MFTGIITHLGKLRKVNKSTYAISADQSLLTKLRKGDSVAINGICLTVAERYKDFFMVDCIPETKLKTNIEYLKIGDLVNLELPATPNSILSGHIVQGHIDGIGKLENIKKQANSYILKFSIPEKLSKYIVNKGSIAVCGIALTVIKAGKKFFTVGIIPHTWKNTMLRSIKLGDLVNIEVDILAKYLEKLTKP